MPESINGVDGVLVIFGPGDMKQPETQRFLHVCGSGDIKQPRAQQLKGLDVVLVF
jgi:hypothetical protein